jgi:Prokaryotic N-terminal methylation motif
MKTSPIPQQDARQSVVRRQCHALTLVELMVAMSVFGLSVFAIIGANIFGLRQDELVRSKLGASDLSRMAVGQLTSEIRSAKMFRVGNGSQSSFDSIPDGQPQQGTALQIYPTTNINSYIQYYFAPESDQLRRRQTGIAGYQIVADHLTNSLFFRAEDFLGNVLTEIEHNYIIAFHLQFYQYQYPVTKVGEGYYYDYYKIEFKVTRRAHD